MLAVYLLLITGTTLIVVEMLNRMSFNEVFKWAVHNPISFIINYLLILLINLLFLVLFNNRKVAYTFLACILWLASLISGIKLKLLGIPLLPNDITLIKEAADISKYLDQLYNLNNIIIVIISLLILLPAIIFVPNGGPVHTKKRIFLSFPLVIVIVSIIYVGPQFIYYIGINDLRWNQSDNYLENGFVTASTTNIRNIKVDAPENYSFETMKDLISDYSSNIYSDSSDPKTNIILLLSESLWDITDVENLELSDDPLKFYHKLAGNYSSGQMVSPQFGGGTVNVEFEVLTGNSMQFLTPGTYPFLQFNREIDSIASILSRQGYHTTVLNSYVNWFYNVRNAYQNLGFDQFISSEFLEQKISGYYLSDEVLVDAIIEQTQRTEGYDFIYGKTVETHFPYRKDKYNEHEIKVLAPQLSDESSSTIEAYIQGIYNFDKALEKLVDYYSENEEPTIIVVFGDHLPVLGDNYSIYKELGYINDNETHNKEKLHQTPILIWNNFKENETKEELNINATYVAPYILNYANLAGTPFTNYLWDCYKKEEIPLNLLLNMESQSIDLNTYELFEYDNLFGKQYGYSLENSKNNIKKSNYYLGFEIPKIENVQIFINNEIGSTLSLTGGKFSDGSIISLNGEELETAYLNENKLIGLLPDKLLKKESKNKFQVIVKDSKNTILSSSEIYYYYKL